MLRKNFFKISIRWCTFLLLFLLLCLLLPFLMMKFIIIWRVQLYKVILSWKFWLIWCIICYSIVILRRKMKLNSILVWKDCLRPISSNYPKWILLTLLTWFIRILSMVSFILLMLIYIPSLAFYTKWLALRHVILCDWILRNWFIIFLMRISPLFVMTLRSYQMDWNALWFACSSTSMINFLPICIFPYIHYYWIVLVIKIFKSSCKLLSLIIYCHYSKTYLYCYWISSRLTKRCKHCALEFSTIVCYIILMITIQSHVCISVRMRSSRRSLINIKRRKFRFLSCTKINMNSPSSMNWWIQNWWWFWLSRIAIHYIVIFLIYCSSWTRILLFYIWMSSSRMSRPFVRFPLPCLLIWIRSILLWWSWERLWGNLQLRWFLPLSFLSILRVWLRVLTYMLLISVLYYWIQFLPNWLLQRRLFFDL